MPLLPEGEESEMKKLVCTRDLPVLKSRRYVRGDPILEWARDDDPILEELARFSGNTGIDDITVEEMDVKDANGKKAARRFRVRICEWAGVCPKYGLLSRRELFALLDEVPYFTVAVARKYGGFDVNTGEGLK